MPSLEKINSWLRAKKYIPNGCQTLSKRPETYVNGVYPKLLKSGHGCEVEDNQGNKFIDYVSSLGAILLGYGNVCVNDAVIDSIVNGEVLLSLPHEKEAALAEKLVRPKLEKVKFFKTGSEATSAAIRVARAYTGRNIVLKCGYNGWHDWAMIQSDRRDGIPKGLAAYTEKFKYNDLQSLEFAATSVASPIAAVILEPVVFDEPKDNFLEKLIAWTHKQGALVIFDEIVTGFRFGVGGAAELFEVQPDLICYGKALGNGYPIAALLGAEKVMSVFERDGFLASGTFSGDLIGITAATAVLEIYEPAELWSNGTFLKLGFKKLCEEMDLPIECMGYAPRTKFEFPLPGHKALFWQECVKRGVLFGHTNFVTSSHGIKTIEATLNVCRDALKIVKGNWADPIASLEGEMPRTVL